jgi:hypothetical protein
MGLIVFILIGVLPGQYALNLCANPAAIERIAGESQSVQEILGKHAKGKTHLSYAQGSAAELVAATPIGAADMSACP